MEHTLTRTALLILGMHRAGTSALARVCALRGAALPHRVLPANAGNVTGYWEPLGVTELNERILDHYDLAWDDPFAAGQLPSSDEMPMHFLEEARRVLREEYGSAELFVLKDPRCTLLQGFWYQALESIGVRVCPVVMMRPCAGVVDSLVRRDRSDPTSGALLYVAYGLEAAKAAGSGASFITYGQLIADWRQATDRIAAEQALSWPDASAESTAAIATFLQPSPRELPPQHLPVQLQSWTCAVWQWFADASSRRTIARVSLEPIEAEFERLSAMLGPLLRDRKSVLRAVEASAEGARHERDQALQVYRETDERLRQAHQAYREQLATADERLRQVGEAYHKQLAAADEQLRETQRVYEAQRERTDAELQQTQADYQQRNNDYVATRVALGAARSQADTARREATALRNELAVMRRSRSWKLTAPLRDFMRVLRGGGADDSPRLLDQAAEPENDDDAAQVGIAAQVVPTPPRVRPHVGLRAYLDEEFGGATPEAVIARIDHYRLPVPTQEARAALRVECGEHEAVEWATGIARGPIRATVTAVDPDVSIVIPVYNQAPFTLACIDALLQHESRYSFEILVGDDGSSDATAAALAVPLPAVRHIRHDVNLGFVRNCNATARHASGRTLVFLNNDTQVLPGWLDELIGTLEANPGIGLVGSKLIYPDGRLQECGGLVWRDGSAWNYGRLGDPRRPEFSYMRDVDYVSGASIALASALWRELEGFDELFVPAYAEDADLAFRVRRHGLRTVVQPLSQLLHFEGISSGTDIGAGAKAYQVENLRKLRARWAGVLEGHRANADQPELEKERGIVHRTLFVDHCTPSPNEDAGSLVAFEIMKAFIANGHKVTFVPEDNFAHMGAATRNLQRLGIEAIYHPAYSRMVTFIAARQDRYDVVFLHRFGVADAHMVALRRAYPGAQIIFLNADLHYLRQMRQAELDGNTHALAQARAVRAKELRVVATADIALVHSDHEQALLQRELPAANVMLFPLIHDPAQQVPGPALREGVCFVGGFQHPPNADGIRWFVQTIWPQVLESRPDEQLYVVGSNVTPDVSALASVRGVNVIGFVEDLDSFLDLRRVSIAPLRYGAGAKGKVAGSLARGVPTVCTPMAAEGMGLEPGVDVLIGETPEAFTRCILALLVDDRQWEQLSRAGLVYAGNVTSRARAHQRIHEILDGRNA